MAAPTLESLPVNNEPVLERNISSTPVRKEHALERNTSSTPVRKEPGLDRTNSKMHPSNIPRPANLERVTSKVIGLPPLERSVSKINGQPSTPRIDLAKPRFRRNKLSDSICDRYKSPTDFIMSPITRILLRMNKKEKKTVPTADVPVTTLDEKFANAQQVA